MVDRYLEFETQSTFTDETFPNFGVNSHVLDVSGEDITGDQQYIYPPTSTGRVKRNRISGPVKFSGPVDIPIYSISAPSFLYYALGAVTTVPNTPVTALNTHTIKKAKTIPFFRAAIGRDEKEHQYVGGIIGGFTLDYSPDEILTGSFDLIFRREKSPLATLATAVTFPDFNIIERAFGGVEVTPRIGGSDVTFVESLSVTLENNVAEDAFALGSKYLPAGIVSELAITGSMDVRYDSSDKYTDWLDGTERQIELNATHGTGDDLRNIDVDLPLCSYDVNRLPTDNIERYVQTIDFTPEQDTNGDPIIITIVNAESNAEISG